MGTPLAIKLEIVVPIGVPGLAEDNTASAPVTWGVAMLVPLLPPKPPAVMEDWIAEPVANRST